MPTFSAGIRPLSIISDLVTLYLVDFIKSMTLSLVSVVNENGIDSYYMALDNVTIRYENEEKFKREVLARCKTILLAFDKQALIKELGYDIRGHLLGRDTGIT